MGKWLEIFDENSWRRIDLDAVVAFGASPSDDGGSQLWLQLNSGTQVNYQSTAEVIGKLYDRIAAHCGGADVESFELLSCDETLPVTPLRRRAANQSPSASESVK